MGPSLGSAIGYQWGPSMESIYGSIHGSINGAIIGVSNRASMGPPMGSIHESINGVHPWGPPMRPIHEVHPWGPSVGHTSFDPDMVSEARRHAGQEARPVGRLHLVQIIPGAAQHLRRGDGVQDRPETPPHPLLPVPRSPTPEVPLPPPPPTPPPSAAPPGSPYPDDALLRGGHHVLLQHLPGHVFPLGGARHGGTGTAPSRCGAAPSATSSFRFRLRGVTSAAGREEEGLRPDWLRVPCVPREGGGDEI